MSLTNRVIIPVVGNRQNPDEQNVFVHSTFTLTPQKPPQKPEPILWKKSMSAFKKFKEKRDRKDKRGDSSIEHPSENLQEVPKSFVKLVKRTEACLSTKILSS